MTPLTMRDLGAYIREQRHSAEISLRQLAKLAGVSNPYLSQIERGVRKPSAEILQQIAKALRISAEALYVQAGILDERGTDSEVPAALLADPHLNERQKQVLLEIYDSFRRENAVAAAETPGATEPAATEPAVEPVPEPSVDGTAAAPARPGAAEPAAPRRAATRKKAPSARRTTRTAI